MRIATIVSLALLVPLVVACDDTPPGYDDPRPPVYPAACELPRPLPLAANPQRGYVEAANEALCTYTAACFQEPTKGPNVDSCTRQQTDYQCLQRGDCDREATGVPATQACMDALYAIVDAAQERNDRSACGGPLPAECGGQFLLPPVMTRREAVQSYADAMCAACGPGADVDCRAEATAALCGAGDCDARFHRRRELDECLACVNALEPGTYRRVVFSPICERAFAAYELPR